MKLHTVFLTIFFLFPLYMFGSITGTYESIRIGPMNEIDTGVAYITKRDSIYSIIWTCKDGGSAVGTGVRNGDSISFVYKEDDSEFFGVQQYKIGKHTLTGPWVLFETTDAGFDFLKKISNDTSLPI